MLGLLEAEEAASGGDANAEEQRRQQEIRQRIDIEGSDIMVTGTVPSRIFRKEVRQSEYLPCSVCVLLP